MRQNKKREVLKVFFEFPNKEFTVREISKNARIPRSTTHRILREIRKEGLIDKENKIKDSLKFRTKKINYFIEEIICSGLIDKLVKELNPSCIILFGSIRKGDSEKSSDIDLFVESSLNKKIETKKFERKLGHKVQLFVEPDINKLQKHLFNNVLNGIKLYGWLDLLKK